MPIDAAAGRSKPLFLKATDSLSFITYIESGGGEDTVIYYNKSSSNYSVVQLGPLMQKLNF